MKDMTAEQIALVQTEFQEIARGFTNLAAYAEARKTSAEMREHNMHLASLVFEHTAQTAFDKLPRWAQRS